MYMLGCNYFWMLCEGIYLHTLIVVAVFAEEQHLHWYYLLGWGEPLSLMQMFQRNKSVKNPLGRLRRVTSEGLTCDQPHHQLEGVANPSQARTLFYELKFQQLWLLLQLNSAVSPDCLPAPRFSSGACFHPCCGQEKVFWRQVSNDPETSGYAAARTQRRVCVFFGRADGVRSSVFFPCIAAGWAWKPICSTRCTAP